MTVQMTMEEYKKLESAREQLEQIKAQVEVVNKAEGDKKIEETLRLLSGLNCRGRLHGYI